MATETFADLGLSPKVQAAIDAAGYANPTPIQAAAIPVALTGRDVLGIAQTGTGKTASFTLPMISSLETGRARARMPRSLILAPTRELAAQVAQSFEKYGVNHKLNVALLIGGVSINDQIAKLDKGVDVLIATPGRLLDHFQRGRVMLMGVEILVIDEADRMLDMGFIPDIEKICKLLPPRRQNLFFSATMPDEITRLVNTFMKDPERIEVARPATTAKTITQLFHYCANCTERDKRQILRDLIEQQNVKNAIIFCNRKRDVAILDKSLRKHGLNAGCLHGDMDQTSRMDTLEKFRNGEITLLAASDVAARGLDIPDVSHIFNFDLPWQSDDYVHRIGRTGRAGKEGTATSLVTSEDFKLLASIEAITGEALSWLNDPPTEDDRTAPSSGGRSTSDRRRSGRSRRATSGDQPAGSTEKKGRSRRPRRKKNETEMAPAAPETAGSTRADAAHAPADHVEQPSRERTPRDPKPAQSESRRRAPESASAKPRNGRRSEDANRPAAKAEGKVTAHAQGFADNIPAFLRRPVRRKQVKAAPSK